VALLPEHAVGSTFDGDAVYAVFRATPGLPGALLGGAAVGAFSDEPLLGGIDLQAFATSGKPVRF